MPVMHNTNQSYRHSISLEGQNEYLQRFRIANQQLIHEEEIPLLAAAPAVPAAPQNASQSELGEGVLSENSDDERDTSEEDNDFEDRSYQTLS